MANFVSPISFQSPEDQAAAQAIERRRALAGALQQQSMEPIEPVKSGRFAVPINPLQGVSKLAQAYAGMLGQQRADEQQQQLASQVQARRGADMSALVAALQGRPASPAGLSEDASGNVTQTPGLPAQSPGQAVGQVLPMIQDPAMQQVGMNFLGQQAAATIPKKPEPYTLNAGARRYNENNQLVASAPEKEDEFVKALRDAGIDPAGPEGRRLSEERVKKLTTHPPAADVKVDVKTGESLGKEIGPMVAESRSGALGALQTAEIANRVRSAISTGNVNVGPTATIRNSIDQISQTLGVAGQSTEERLVNTRNVIRGLAQSTVAARKQLKGQGQVSDFEGKLLQKAESGEIDNMTMPELKSFMDLSERLAKLQYDLHTHNVDVMRKRPDLQNLVPFYEVPEWKAFNAPDAAPAQQPGAQAKKPTVKWNDLGH